MRWATAWLSLAMGCSAPTQLVVAVQTDMDVPAELGAFSVSVEGPGDRPVSVTGGGRQRYGAPIPLAAPSDLPATFGLRPRDGDASRKVTVRATAWSGDTALFETRAVTGFVDGEQLRLDLFLAGRCREEVCAPGQTCTRGGCRDPEVPAGSLPEWDGRIPTAPLDDGGVPVETGWPHVLGWADRASGDVAVTDAVAGGGVVWIVGTVVGHAWLRGDPAGATEIDAATSRVWVSCLDPHGAPCGLAVFGSDQGSVLAPRAARDGAGRLLVAATYTGGPVIDRQPLDAGPGGRGGLVLRWDPDTDTREVGLLKGAGGVSLGAIARLDSDAMLLSIYADDRALTLTHFNGDSEATDLSASGGFVLLVDASFAYLGFSLQAAAEPSSPAAAAVAAGISGRTSVAATDRFMVQNFHEGEAMPWGSAYVNSTACAATAAAAAGDGSMALTCSATSRPQVGGFLEGQVGDIWVGLWGDPSGEFPTFEAAIGGPGEEVVLDATGDDSSMYYFVGRFSGETDLGGEALQGDPEGDAFLFSARRDGVVLVVDRFWAFDSPGADEATAVAFDPAVGVVLAGRLGESSEIEGTSLGVEGATALAFVHRVLP